MGEFSVKQIKNLMSYDLSHLVIESRENGFRFLGRLVQDYKDGTNAFNQNGEALFGVYNRQDELIAIGGLNIDPFSNNQEIGRLRRFYVAKEYRRHGIGTILLNAIMTQAKNHFKVLVLHTDTHEADQFYSSYGFHKNSPYPNSTHFLSL